MSTEINKTVSVVLPFLNRERYVGAAIESILASSYRPMQIIAVDNGSTDQSAAIVQSYPDVEYYVAPLKGIAQALNVGLRQVRGAYLAFLDSDDLWSKDKLELQMQCLEATPSLDLVFGHLTQFVSPDVTVAEAYSLPAAPMKGMTRGTMLARREVFDRVGEYDASLRGGEFIDWFLRAIESDVTYEVLPDVLLRRRVHDSNFGIMERDSQRDFLKILKASLDRRRQRT